MGAAAQVDVGDGRIREQVRGGAVELVATMPGALLTRLNWDESCRAALGIPENAGPSP